MLTLEMDHLYHNRTFDQLSPRTHLLFSTLRFAPMPRFPGVLSSPASIPSWSPAIHPANDRFFTPSFSSSSESIFSFHIDLRGPLVFRSVCPSGRGLRALVLCFPLTLLSLAAWRLLFSLASLFRSSTFCFQPFAASFLKTGGWVYPSTICPPSGLQYTSSFGPRHTGPAGSQPHG